VKKQTHLLQEQKIFALGTLAGGIIHDFNNLLTVIRGNVNLAELVVDKVSPPYKYLKKIRIAADNAASLSRQWLLFSREYPVKHHSLNINRIVRGVLEMFERLISKNITLNTILTPGLWAIRANGNHLEQVILNLVINARDAMPEGGTLTLKTENVVLEEENSSLAPESRLGKFICLSVTDTGIGMDKEIIQHIFVPYFTTKGPEKGTGLGLAIVHSVVKQHEGWINVQSRPGKGSTVKVYLPAFLGQSEEI